MNPVQRTRLVFGFLACLGMAGRVAIPAGSMPAPAADGTYVKLCPHGLNGALLPAAEGHADHSPAVDGERSVPEERRSPSRDSRDTSNVCPVGAAFAFAALLDGGQVVAPLPVIAATSQDGVLESASRATTPSRSRAPPRRLTFAA